jgi:hypothetical protein
VPAKPINRRNFEYLIPDIQIQLSIEAVDAGDSFCSLVIDRRTERRKDAATKNQ